MIYSKLLFLTFFTFFNFFQATENIDFQTEILYQFSYQSNGNDTTSRNTELATLLLNDNTSVFLTLKKFQRDSAFNLSPLKTGIAYRFGKIDFTQFQIWKNKEDILTQEPIDGRALSINNEILQYKEAKSDIQWVLEDETKQIGQYNCQKATTSYGGRKWIAWFTSDIPLSDGPYKFSGLPGLILRVSDTQNQFMFEFQGLYHNSKTIVPLEVLRPDIKIEDVSRKEFIERRNYLNKNMFSVAISTVPEANTDESRKRIQAETLNDNWIELL